MIKAKAVHDGVPLSQDWRPQQLLTQAEVKKSEEEEGWQAAWRACASWPDVEEQLRTSPVPLMGVNVEKPAESNPTYVAAGAADGKHRPALQGTADT